MAGAKAKIIILSLVAFVGILMAIPTSLTSLLVTAVSLILVVVVLIGKILR